MRPQKVDDTVLINNLMNVLRTKGYDGASLNELAAASGLQKASLYHRFPGGKKDIVKSVLGYIGEWSQNNIVNIINHDDLTPIEKLNTVIQNLDNFYEGGENSCVMKTLSMDNSFVLFENYLKQGINAWLESFKQLALLFNHNKEQSKTIANEVIVQIQGSLVVCKISGELSPFKKALNNIKEIYIS